MPPFNQIIEPVVQAGNSLANLIQAEIEKLRGQQAQYAALQSSLDALRRRHYMERSFINQFTDWYGTKTWYERGVLALVIAAISTLVGAIASAIEAAIAIGMALFCLVTYIADNHFTTTLNRDGAFAEDIVALEGQLKTLFDALNEYNDKIKTLFTELLSNNLKVVEYLQLLDDSNKTFQEEIEKFAKATAMLEQMTKKLMDENTLLIEQRGKTSVNFVNIIEGLASLQASYKAIIDGKINAQETSGIISNNGGSMTMFGEEVEDILARQRRQRVQFANLSNEGQKVPYTDRLRFLSSDVEAQESPVLRGMCI